jgi:EPS-associated MarR family transcriptional regulator
MPTELQFRVLRLLESNPHLSQRELSKSLGVSLGGVNYCLNALIAKGSIKIQNFRNNQNKWVYAYLLTPQGLAEKTALTGAFLKRKMQEYQELKVEIESLSCEVANQKAIQEAEDEVMVLKDGSAVVIEFNNVSNANQSISKRPYQY